MKILILGCGYIGTALAHLAKSQGHDVLGVVIRKIETTIRIVGHTEFRFRYF